MLNNSSKNSGVDPLNTVHVLGQYYHHHVIIITNVCDLANVVLFAINQKEIFSYST